MEEIISVRYILVCCGNADGSIFQSSVITFIDIVQTIYKRCRLLMHFNKFNCLHAGNTVLQNVCTSSMKFKSFPWLKKRDSDNNILFYALFKVKFCWFSLNYLWCWIYFMKIFININFECCKVSVMIKWDRVSVSEWVRAMNGTVCVLDYLAGSLQVVLLKLRIWDVVS